MENKLKNMTADQIFEKETELRTACDAVYREYQPAFEALGYSLTLEYSRCTEAEEYKADTLEEPGSYRFGYNCRAIVLVKRPKTAEELASDEETAEEMKEAVADDTSLVPEEDNAEESDEAVEEPDMVHKAIAFTQLTFTRIYRAFWIDKVVLCDSVEPMRCDLEEFLAKIKEKEETEANPVD